MDIVQGLQANPEHQLAKKPMDLMRRTELFKVAVSKNLISQDSPTPKKEQLIRIIEEGVVVNDPDKLREVNQPVDLNVAHLAQQKTPILDESEDEDIFGPAPDQSEHNEQDSAAIRNKYHSEVRVLTLVKMFKEDFPDAGKEFPLGTKKAQVLAAVEEQLAK